VDRLETTYAREQLFMDVDGIAPGLDFARALAGKVDSCGVMLAIIGPNRLDARDEKHQRLLDNSDDFVVSRFRRPRGGMYE
jgi:hypothetical protein